MTRLTIVAAVLMFASCAPLPPPANTAAESPRLLSLSPASLGKSLSLSQIVTGDHDGHVYRMRFEVDITPSRLAIVGLSPLGVTLFTIIQEKGDLTVKTAAKELTTVDPRHMLFDIYATYWPRKALQTALSPIRMRLEQTGDGRIRRIRGLDGNLIAEIQYPPKQGKSGKITILHYDFPYRLTIETLEARDAR